MNIKAHRRYFLSQALKKPKRRDITYRILTKSAFKKKTASKQSKSEINQITLAVTYKHLKMLLM